jgi:hypothetical protein
MHERLLRLKWSPMVFLLHFMAPTNTSERWEFTVTPWSTPTEFDDY